jgi:hypothetical protein
MKQETQYDIDLSKVIKVNNGLMTRATWNLIISIRDVKLWKAGMKPHRGWRITDVKKYFGLKGNPDKVLEGLLKLKATYDNEKTNIKL